MKRRFAILTSVAVAVVSVSTATGASGSSSGQPGHRATVAINLNRVLADTPMRGTGWKLEQAGHTHGVSPYFIAAIAATESSLGRASCRGNPRNAWGLASCGSSWSVPYFHTWAQAYQFMGRFLMSRWSGARTAYDYHGYAACSPCWGRKTAYWMQRLFGVGPGVRYP